MFKRIFLSSLCVAIFIGANATVKAIQPATEIKGMQGDLGDLQSVDK